MVDRIILKDDDDFYNRLADAIEMAVFEGKGRCIIEKLENSHKFDFQNNDKFLKMYTF